MYDSLKITPKTRGYQIIFNHTNFHLYHYAGNNPIRYTDPDGRVIKDKETEILVKKIFENTTKIEYNENVRIEFEKNLVQARSGKIKIADLIYIGGDDKQQTVVLTLLQEYVNSENELVKVQTYTDMAVRKDVTEYWIVTYDSDTEKTGFIYNVLIDIGNDGYIDYIEWIPLDPEKVVTE